jgi:MFS family permease
VEKRCTILDKLIGGGYLLAVSNNEFRFKSLILPFYLPSALTFLGAGMVLPILALYARNLGASIAVTSIIVGLFGLGNLLLNIPAGILITRFGNRSVILVSTFLEGTIALMLGFSRDIRSFGILVFLLGTIHTVFFISRLSFFRALVPAASRGRALALIGGERRLGQFIGPIFGGIVAQNLGYGIAFWIFAATMYLSLIFLLICLPKSDNICVIYNPNKTLSRITGILKENRKVFSTAGLAVIILQLLRAARQAIVPLVGESIGLTVSQIGFVVGIMFFVEFLLFYPTGIIMDRWGRKFTAVPCLILFSISLVLLPLAGSFSGLVFVVLVAGLGNGLGSGINMTLSTDFAPSKNPAEFIGVWRFIVDLGTTGGPFLVGVVAAAFSLGIASVVIGTLGFAGAAVMGFLVTEPLQR